MELWEPIPDFPGYEVSNTGLIRNEETQYTLGQYENGSGFLQVVMSVSGKNHARAVHKLVAQAFVNFGGGDQVPVHIDYDRHNNHADNLEWKPLWFANKRTRQHNRTTPLDNRPIRIIETGEVFENSLECAKAISGLEELILNTAMAGRHTSYLRRHFEFVRN